MIEAIIIDDETHCINHLTELIGKYGNTSIRLNGAFRTLSEGEEAIARLRPELVFLDIQLGQDSGFDLLRRLPVVHFDVIFVTAFDSYAVQAFSYNKGKGGSVSMIDNTEIEVSTRRKDELLKRLAEG